MAASDSELVANNRRFSRMVWKLRLASIAAGIVDADQAGKCNPSGVAMKTPEDTAKMVNELADLEEGLSPWEVDFIDDMFGRDSYTTVQAHKIEEIWNLRIGSKQ